MLPFDSYSRYAAAHRRFLCFSMSRTTGHVVLLGPVHRGLGLVILQLAYNMMYQADVAKASMICSRYELRALPTNSYLEEYI